MAEYSFFWDGTSVGDATFAPYDSNEFSDSLRALTGSDLAASKSGVLKSIHLQNFFYIFDVNQVTVQSGKAQVFGSYYVNEAPGVNIVIPSANSTSRIDYIVLRKDWAAKTVRLARVAGVEGVGPGPLIQNEGTIWDMPLYRVTVNTAGVVTLNTDDRIYLPIMGSLGTTTLEGITDIPNLILSEYTKDLIDELDNLTSLPNLISVPKLNYQGLTGLTPPLCSLSNYPNGRANIPPTTTWRLQNWPFANSVRIDTTGGVMFNTGQPDRITAPLSGLYEVTARIGLVVGINRQSLGIQIRRNSLVPAGPPDDAPLAESSVDLPDSTVFDPGGAAVYCHLGPVVINLNQLDYVELYTRTSQPSPFFANSVPDDEFTLKYIGARTPITIGNVLV